VSPYVVLAIVFGSSATIATAVGYAYVSRLRYRFLQHTYDKGGPADLMVAAEATRDPGDDTDRTVVIVQADLPWVETGDTGEDNHRVPLLVEDSGSSTSEPPPKSLPAPTEPDS
jgi:hypothetical protein